MRIDLIFAILLLSSLPIQAQDAEMQGEAVGATYAPGECPFEGASDIEGLECGVLTVPERRDIPGGRTLDLRVAVLRSHSPDPAPDPLVFLSGGPGSGSIEHTAGRARHPFWNRLRPKRDLVFFDQRGTGYSEPAFCPEMDATIATVRYHGLSEAEQRDEKVRAVAACREQLLAQGVDPTAYHSVASARDLGDLRRALGYDSWNLLGLSYGTRLALAALREAPNGIRSVILDSTLPPDVAHWANGGERFSRSLRLAFDQCAADPDCQEAFPTLEEDFYAVIADLEQNPIILSVPDTSRFPDGRLVVDGTLWAQGVFQAFYDGSIVPLFPLFVQESKRRNQAVLRALAEGLTRETGAVRWGMNTAVNCYEVAPFSPPDQMLANRRQYPRLAPWFESSINSPVAHVVCDALHGARADTTEFRPVSSDVPVLILAGEFDPITPPAYGRQAARTLPNSTFVEVPAMGHGVSPSSDCTRDLIDVFLEEPGQSPDTSCVASLPSVSFVTNVHVNSGVHRFASALRGGVGPLAGVALLGLVLLSAVVGWPLAALVRRFRGHPAVEPAGAVRVARPLAGAAAALVIVFLAGLVVTIRQTAAENRYILAFGVPGEAAWLFALPWIVAALTPIVAVLAFLSWRRGWWTWAGRTHYALVATACLGYVAFVAKSGFM